MSAFPSQFQLYVIDYLPLQETFNLNVTRYYDVAENASMAAIGFSIWTVHTSFSSSQRYPPFYILLKTVSNKQLPMKLQEINMRYNNT